MSSHRFSSKFLVSGVLLVAGCFDGGDNVAQVDHPHSIALVGPGPDLVESTVGDPPGSAVLGQTFSASDTVTNQGTVDAAATFTKYYLSTSISPQYLLGERSVGAITATSSDSGTGSVTIPIGVPAGSYFLLACADSGSGTGGRVSQVDETDENNNCSASAGSVAVTGPNLIESGVSATLDMTGLLTVADTVQNTGGATAPASISRWWLSTDAVKDGSDGFIRNCTNGGLVPGRNIATIGSGGTDAGQSTTTPLCVRDATGLHQPANGTYYVIVCADTTNLVGETDETDNCAASSGTISVVSGAGPDLIESAVGTPPATGNVGDSFPFTDTVQNVGGAPAPSSFTKFYLSTDGTTLSLYLNTRAVGGLNSLATDVATTTMTIPNGTPVGTYFVVACADSGPGTGGRVSEIVETNENNNCTASASAITIGASGLPDLVITAISDPPATGGAGSTFNITDTTANIGVGDAGPFFNKYYLSTNGLPGGIVAYLATGPAAALPANTTEQVTATATIPAGLATGSYYVVGCADSGPGNGGRFSEIVESDENNNCRASAGTISFGPDLVISVISDPPGAGAAGDTFGITDTTTNIGSSDAGAFFNKYYLSTNQAPGGIVAYLATGSASALTAGAGETVTATATIPLGVTPGTYFMVGCADAGPGNGARFSQIDESNENNNCTASAGTITIGSVGSLPDLVINTISAPPATGTAGDSFAITDTTANIGGGNAGTFFNKYYLSNNGLPGGIIAYLATGSAGALTASTSETVSATASIPSGVAPGAYWLVGCADSGPSNSGRLSQIDETDENNNCITSATQIVIN